MGQNPINERRRYFRLEYPAAERPTVRHKGSDYRVSQVSEAGVKILLDRCCAVRAGQFFAGVIRFKDGGLVPIVGVVLRFDEREMVVKLTIGIGFNYKSRTTPVHGLRRGLSTPCYESSASFLHGVCPREKWPWILDRRW